MKNRFIVTIDGPAGSGKSTIAKLLAERDNFLHIDTGALYRIIGYIFDSSSIDKNSLNRVKLDIKINSRINIFWNNRNIEEFIRTEQCGMLASNVAKLDFVRDFINKFTRKIADNEGKFVIDGRDCGSIIFPNANLKIFLTADIKERAKRRAKEDKKDKKEIEKEIEKRDQQDRNRNLAPLIIPKNAIKIDTTAMSIENVYETIRKLTEETYENQNR